MSMLNISKYHRAIVGCSAIATASLFCGLVQPASAGDNPGSNHSGSNVTSFPGNNPSSNPGGSNATGSNSTGNNAAKTNSVGGYSSDTISRAGNVLSRYNSALSKYERAAAALAQAETGQPTASNNSPVRYGREPGDLAACGCLNQDTVGKNPNDRPELVAAKAAEAEAAAELAAAKAEARQVIESAKSSNTSAGTTVYNPIW
jgi:hypothetical protein